MNARTDGVGEASCTAARPTRENGDDASDERPLKKARFAWQVKGKYHMRQPERSEAPRSAPARRARSLSVSDRESGTDSDSDEAAASAEQNLEILGDYLLKQDLSMMESGGLGAGEVRAEVAATERTVPAPHAACPRYTPSRHAPPSLVVVRARHPSEDQYLEAWQERQMAKCFVDNTINRVLDSWAVAPPRRRSGAELPEAEWADYMPSHLQVNVADLLDNLPASDTVENEGILMAISAHGLRRPAPFHHRHRPLSPDLMLEEDFCEGEMSYRRDSVSAATVRLESDAAWSELTRACTCSHALRDNMAAAHLPPLVPFHRRAHPPPPAPPEPPAAAGAAPPPPARSGGELAFDEHLNFMDAAVSFAIQNQGLTSFTSEYG